MGEQEDRIKGRPGNRKTKKTGRQNNRKTEEQEDGATGTMNSRIWNKRKTEQHNSSSRKQHTKREELEKHTKDCKACVLHKASNLSKAKTSS